MARNSKDGVDSKETIKLKKEQEATDKAQKEREAQMQAEEAAKLEEAQKESDNQAEPIATPVAVPADKRKAAWLNFLADYKAHNPVKFAQKEANGEFKEIPASFTGVNQLNIKQ